MTQSKKTNRYFSTEFKLEAIEPGLSPESAVCGYHHVAVRLLQETMRDKSLNQCEILCR